MGGFRLGSGEGSGRLWCRARSGSTGFRRRFRRSFQEAFVQRQSGSTGSGKGCREGPGEGFGNLYCRVRPGSTGFPALGFAARFRKICKNETLRLLGIPPKLISFLRKRVLFHHGFPGSSCFGLGFRCLSPLFQECARQFHEFCNAHDLGGNMQCCCLVPMLVQLFISSPNCVS